jgi:hypothetical protein
VLAACNGWPHFRGGPTLAGVAVESTIGVANVGSLVEHWRGSGPVTSFSDSPVVTGGKVYTAAAVYDASAGPACSGTPTVCQPVWTLAGDSRIEAPTTVSGGLQVRLPRPQINGTETLSAFDAAGSQGCSGSPKVCQPVRQWRLPPPHDSFGSGVDGLSAPTVSGSGVFAGDMSTHFVASSLPGDASCTAAPTVCPIRWLGRDGEQLLPFSSAVAGGRVYVQGAIDVPARGGVVVFDEAGVASCGGAPVICDPLWRYDTGLRDSTKQQAGPWTTPVVDGVLYAGRRDFTGGAPYSGSAVSVGTLMAFDAVGVQGCDGVPTVCQPLWSAPLPGNAEKLGFVGMAVFGGRVYVPTEGGVSVFDAKGVTGCGGSPKVCSPIATLGFGSAPGTRGAVTVANGVAYVGAMDGLFAFDANLSQGCSGAPVVCAPLLHTLVGTSVTSPAVVAGQVHVVSDGQVVTFGLP